MSKRIADPRSGPKNDLETWMEMVAEIVGPGCLAQKVHAAQIHVEREAEDNDELEKGQRRAMEGYLMVCGVHNIMQKSLRELVGDHEEELAKAMDRYEQLLTRAKICVHNLSTLPGEIRTWRAQEN